MKSVLAFMIDIATENLHFICVQMYKNKYFLSKITPIPNPNQTLFRASLKNKVNVILSLVIFILSINSFRLSYAIIIEIKLSF